MKFASQPDLPYPTPSTLASRSTVRVVARGGRRAVRTPCATRATGSVPLRGPDRFEVAVPRGGKSFAVKRIRHTVETVGSCMILALFLVLFLFG